MPTKKQREKTLLAALKAVKSGNAVELFTAEEDLGQNYDAETGAVMGDPCWDPALLRRVFKRHYDNHPDTELYFRVLKKDAKFGGESDDEEGQFKLPSQTELELAKEFAKKYGGTKFLHAPIGSGWMMWTGCYWEQVSESSAFGAAAKVCRESEATGREKIRLIESVRRAGRQLNPMLVKMSAFNSDPELLNTPGGIVNLKTGKITKPVPEAMMTKVTAVSPDFKMKTPVWDKFVREILPEIDVREYLLTAIGYALTGHNREHHLFFAYGAGANGKSVLFETVRRVMGEYARTTDHSTFMETPHERHMAHLAVLHDSRLLIASEVKRSAKIDDVKLKQMTGGEAMSANFMRKDPFTFVPQWTIFMTGNHKPRIPSVDYAIRRRIRLIPFTVQIPDTDRDPELKDKLVAEYPGILAKLILYSGEYLSTGLIQNVQAVNEAGEAWLDEEDWSGRMMSDLFEDADHGNLTLKEAQDACDAWMQSEGYKWKPRRRQIVELLTAKFGPKGLDPVSRVTAWPKACLTELGMNLMRSRFDNDDDGGDWS